MGLEILERFLQVDLKVNWQVRSVVEQELDYLLHLPLKLENLGFWGLVCIESMN